MDISFKVDDKKVRRAMRQVQRQVRNTGPVLRGIAEDEIDKAKMRIRTSKTDPDNRRWQAWSYDTLVQRQREGNVGRGLLYKSGFLLKSFFYKIKGKQLTVSNKAPAAEYLQNGTNNMPARAFLGWSSQSRKDVKNAIQKQIRKYWK